MTDKEKEYSIWCVKNDVHKFYKWKRWEKVRAQVLAMDKCECQKCRERHRYKRADTVHHVNHLKDRPDLALEIWYWDPVSHSKRRNLVSLCHQCHEEVHGWRKNKKEESKKVVTEERWD